MQKQTNPQDKNVGNLGDFIKHAALVKLLKILAEIEAEKPIIYLDPFAYKIRAKIADAENWQSFFEDFKQKDYKDYKALETSYVKQGQYLCSPGIARAILPDNRILILAEKHKATREKLLEQIAYDKPSYETSFVFDDAFKIKIFFETTAKTKMFWLNANEIVFPQGAVFALIDDFTLSSDTWHGSLAAINLLHDTSKPAIIETFHAQKKSESSFKWRESLDNFAGPIATIRRGDPFSHYEYFLAVYATNNIAERVRAILKNLGWQM